MTQKQIVNKVLDGMDRQDILCTTHQMRNFYGQFRDGYFRTHDVMNYIQHHQIVRWIRPGDKVLDVCCGRGLILPLLRYNRKDIISYTGVDIEPRNAIFTKKRVTDSKPIGPEYYPFAVHYVEANVAEMSNYLPALDFTFLIYTSSIEHMHKDVGMASLHECRKVAVKGAPLILTCPNTPEDQDGYDTQYKAHVYEWKRSELLEGLSSAGFEVISEFGLLSNIRPLKAEMEKYGLGPVFEHIKNFVPAEWYVPVLATMFPQTAKEIGFLCKAV